MTWRVTLCLPIIAMPLIADSKLSWPISASEQPDVLSDTFGPRIRNANYPHYDFHRGIDIPVPCNTPVHAVADGYVRLVEVAEGYDDRLVQLCHPPEEAGLEACDVDDNGDALSPSTFFTNYIHVASTSVTKNEFVKKGQQIALSGESDILNSGVCTPDTDRVRGGFDHLHFEIRKEGSKQKHAVHPLRLLSCRAPVWQPLEISARRSTI